MFEIVERYTRALLYRSETASTAREAVIEAVKTGANLAGANLAGADLTGANGLLPNGLIPLQILGTKHGLIVRKPGCLQIGCHLKPLVEWEETYELIGRGEGYSDQQIAEYRSHIAHARSWMESHGVVDVEQEVPAEASA